LWHLTGNEEAYIVNMLRPMKSNAVIVDKFAYIQEEILPLFMVLMYLLPIYRMTSRIVSEK